MTSSRPNGLSDNRMGIAEITWPAVFIGVILSVVMGAANVYLGLRAGMTVSASIPAAVIAMGILRGVLRRTSVLESNIVQTTASAGESLAAGIIFTMPALLMTGVWESFNYWTTTLIALSGGLLGILLMIPMRQVFVVDNKELKFPEGLACAEVLRAGETTKGRPGDTSTSGLYRILAGIVVGGVMKFLQSFVGLFLARAEAAVARDGRVYYMGADVSPALLAVGYIVTLPIAVQIFAGGAIGWLMAIPILGSVDVEATEAVDMAFELWRTKVRYMGVGAMVVGGFSSIWTVRAGLWAAVRQLIDIMTRRPSSTLVDRTSRNLSGPVVLSLGIVCVCLIAGIYYTLLDRVVGISFLTTAVMLVMSFFFAAVASYIVGLVGNSNSPVSGMTIMAVLGTGALMLFFGFGGTAGIVATLGVAGVVCCVACTSGDVCNDLKTGYLVGAAPRSQQIMQVIGVLVAAFVMAPVMMVLHEGSIRAGHGGIGGTDLPAPQAALFSALATGFFTEQGNLPKDMIIWGIGIGVLLLLADRVLDVFDWPIRLHVMPVAVGIYLPLGLSVPILLGGIIRSLVNQTDSPDSDNNAQHGVLISSGIIAGESLTGVLLAILAYVGISTLDGAQRIFVFLDLPESFHQVVLQSLSASALVAVAVWVYIRAVRAK